MSNHPTCAHGEITQQLHQWQQGDPEGLQKLVEMIYSELKAMAVRQYQKIQPGMTVQPTVLVNEVYLMFAKKSGLAFDNRYAFFAFAGLLMRQILVDMIRRQNRDKRGGAHENVPLLPDIDLPDFGSTLDNDTFLNLNQAIERLSKKDKRQVELLQMRFFCGLKLEEIADLAGISTTSVKRELRIARHWLAGQLSSNGPSVTRGSVHAN